MKSVRGIAGTDRIVSGECTINQIDRSGVFFRYVFCFTVWGYGC